MTEKATEIARLVEESYPDSRVSRGQPKEAQTVVLDSCGVCMYLRPLHFVACISNDM